jgi:GT2 family glycosyltransferase
LEGVSRLEYPREKFETIVVDDGSDLPLESEATAEPFPSPFSLKFVRLPNSGPARARNYGVSVSRGEWLAFIDDDCVPEPDWLQRMDEAAGRYPCGLLGGRVVNGCPENIFAEVNQQLLDSVTEWFLLSRSPIAFITTNNMAVSRSAFEKVGGFNNRFRTAAAEDREFCARWLAAGKEIRRVPDAGIRHYHPQTLRTFLSMHLRYGKGSAMFHRERSSSPTRHFSSGLYSHLIRRCWGGHQPEPHRALAGALLVLSQAVTAAGYLTARVGKDTLLTEPAPKADSPAR